MTPTPHLRWFEVLEPTSDANGTPVVTGRMHYSTNYYVLKQWWAGDTTGEWRLVAGAENNDPPAPFKKCAEEGCKNITSGVHAFCNACLADERNH